MNGIAAYLDDGTIDTTHVFGATQSQYTPQIIDSGIINDTLNWIKIQGTFISNGSEKLITIGNFSNNAHIHLLPLIDTTGLSPYIFVFYLVDDVSVIDCDNVPFAGNDTLIHPGDSAWLGPHEQLLPYTWYALGSAVPIDSGGGFWVHPTVTTTYVLQQDLCGQTKFDTIKVRVWPDTVNEVNQLIGQSSNTAIWPNPGSGVVNIKGARGCDVIFYDLAGREVWRKKAENDTEQLDISTLDNGSYIVEIMEPTTGYRVIKRITKQ